MPPDVSTAFGAGTSSPVVTAPMDSSAPSGFTPGATGRKFGSSSIGRLPPSVSRPTAIYLASRVLTLVALAVTTTFSHKTMIGEMDLWDGQWFLRATEHGWPSRVPYVHGHVVGNTIAFFPLFPLTIRWLAAATGLPPVAVGVFVSGAGGLTAMLAVWRLVRHYAGDEAADRATLLLAFFPGSFVFSFIYSEGMVLTFVALGLLMLLQRRWLLAGLLGMAATATSPVALAFAVAAAWCAGYQIVRGRHWRSLMAPLIAPLGFVAYMVWLWWHTGDLLAWRVTEQWGWHSTVSFTFWFRTVASFVADPIATNKTTDLLFAGTVVTVACAAVAIRQRMPAPVLLYGLFAAALALVSSPVGLRPRFILLAFPLVLAVGIRLRGRALAIAVGACSFLLVVITVFSASSFAIFP